MNYLKIAAGACSMGLSLWAWGPGGGGFNPGGPGGGGNQPDGPGGGGGNSFVFDTFLTDPVVSNGCIVYGSLWVDTEENATQVVVPSTVTEIADGAMAGAAGVQSLDLTAANAVTAVPNSLAAGCPALTSATLPASVTQVDESAFTMDAALATFTGTGVSVVGDYAFYGCSSLVLSAAAKSALTTTGDSALDLASYVTPDGSVCRTEAAPIVDWLESIKNMTDAKLPSSYATTTLKQWLIGNPDRLEDCLWSQVKSTNGCFRALNVKGRRFEVAAADDPSETAIAVSLLVSTNLNAAVWTTISTDAQAGCAYEEPTAPHAFAKLIYTLPW